MENYQIFISYRRDGGDMLAGRLADKLRTLGYGVFFDVESMRSGLFNTQILEAITLCKDVIVVLPPCGLDRCSDDNDWVRKELSYAIEKGKNIIPVLMRGFIFPEALPDDINKIRFMQGVQASSDYFDASVKKIVDLLLSKPNIQNSYSYSNSNPQETFKSLLNELYDIMINYRNYLRSGNALEINMSSKTMEKHMMNIYNFSERYKYSEKELSDIALKIVLQFDHYGKAFNKFANFPDRTTDEAQQYAHLAETEFYKLIDIIIQHL